MIPVSLAQVAQAIGASPEPDYEHILVRRVTTDSRDVQEGDLFFAICGERFDGHDFIDKAAATGAVACVCARDRGLRTNNGDGSVRLRVKSPVEALGRFASRYRSDVIPVGTKVIAVTGSNGKTTTKGMIDHVLAGTWRGKAAPKSFNNNIGVPLTLLSADASDRYIVVEIGTNAPGEVAELAAMAEPNVAVITSIGEAHLEGLGDIEAVATEKSSLLEFVRPGGIALVNVDRREIRPQLARLCGARLMTFGFDPTADLRVTDARGTVVDTSFKLDGRYRVSLPMPGFHHATNATAAFGVSRWLAMAPEEIIERLATVQPATGRTAVISLDGLTIVDDTYNANPASMSAAIDTLRRSDSGRRVMVMGDMLELGMETASWHIRQVRRVFGAGIEVLFAVGPSMADAAARIVHEADGTQVITCADAESACEPLAELLSDGDTVWLKGSRLVALDRVVEYVTTDWQARHRQRTVA